MHDSLGRLLYLCVLTSLLAYYGIDTEHPISSRAPKINTKIRWRGTYISTSGEVYYRRPELRLPDSPDTTAVILNWSRLPNVIELVKVMCNSLQDTFAQVFVWNNNPLPLRFEDFAEAQCPSHMLRIHNSPNNVYFQARFLACARATTRYCFIQDDDYFIPPPIIRAMAAKMAESQHTTIHLLPAHEMLYSTLSTLRTGLSIHTLFAWLGYGTMVERSQIQAFLDLLRTVNVTDDALKMADNYFTILSNRLPELWFDQNHELGGGTPFTVGTVGEERNKRHIVDAGFMLDSLVHMLIHNSTSNNIPYLSFPTPPSWAAYPTGRAACISFPCMVETNIRLLPDLLNNTVSSASELVAQAANQLDALSDDIKEHYVQFSLSSAVDADPATSFYSFGGEAHLTDTVHGRIIERCPDAMEGDWITLDWMKPDFEDKDLELALLIDPSNEAVLSNSRLETFADGEHWHKIQTSRASCSMVEGGKLLECRFALDSEPTRKVRVWLERDVSCGWALHEMWLRERWAG